MTFSSNPWADRDKQQGATPTPVVSAMDALQDLYPTNIKDERKCLQEIRVQGKTIPSNYILNNGMKATEFALLFVMRHHLKRKNTDKQSLAATDIEIATDSHDTLPEELTEK